MKKYGHIALVDIDFDWEKVQADIQKKIQASIISSLQVWAGDSEGGYIGIGLGELTLLYGWKEVLPDDFKDSPEITVIEDVNTILEYQFIMLDQLKAAMGHKSLLNKQSKLYAQGKIDTDERINKTIKQMNERQAARIAKIKERNNEP